MSAANPIRHRTDTQPDHESASSGETVSWGATYTYEANGFRYTDEALLRDVSRRGCAIRGRTSMAVGSKTRVTFYLSDHQRPLSVPARVSWVRDTIFGVEFLQLSHSAYERLQRFIHQRLEDPQAGAGEMRSITLERRKATLRVAVSLVVLGALSGCGTLPPSSPAASTPFFTPTTDERVNLALQSSELDAMAMECAAVNTCPDHVSYARAFVSLFENREAARASFERVIAVHPASPFAASSALWLELLKDDGPSSPSNDPERRILRDLTTQWLLQRMVPQPAISSLPEPTFEVAKPALVEALHQKVRERDRRIAHLRAQLDALKVINQEQEERRKMRPPASFFPKLEKDR